MKWKEIKEKYKDFIVDTRYNEVVLFDENENEICRIPLENLIHDFLQIKATFEELKEKWKKTFESVI